MIDRILAAIDPSRESARLSGWPSSSQAKSART